MKQVFQRFSERLYYHQGDIQQAQCYTELAETLNREKSIP